MLDLAIKHVDELHELQYKTWDNEKYKYWNNSAFFTPMEIYENNACWHQYVSMFNGRVIGYIAYEIERSEFYADSVSILNFYDDYKFIFGMDLRQAFKDIFEKYHYRKVNFSVTIGNPAEKYYDRLTERYGGCVAGYFKEDVKLFDGKYYDRKFYEILAKDYFKAVKHKKIEHKRKKETKTDGD